MATQNFVFNDIAFSIDLGALDVTGKLSFVNPPFERVQTVIELYDYHINDKAMTITIINNTWKQEDNGVMIDESWKKQAPRIYDDQPTEQGIKLYTMYAMLTNQPLPNWEIYRRARVNEALETLYKEGVLDRFVYCYDPADNWGYKQPVEVSAIVTHETAVDANDGAITVTVVNPQEGKVYNYSIDGGVTWSANPSFTDLVPNTYVIAAKCVEDNFVGYWSVTVDAFVDDTLV